MSRRLAVCNAGRKIEDVRWELSRPRDLGPRTAECIARMLHVVPIRAILSQEGVGCNCRDTNEQFSMLRLGARFLYIPPKVLFVRP